MSLSELGIGDIIRCKGTVSEIAWVTEIASNYIKFIDSMGKKRRWSPIEDGGTVDKVGLNRSNEALGFIYNGNNSIVSFYEYHIGRFVIPFEEITYDISISIMSLIGNGWALTAYEDCGDKYYVVYSLRKDSSGWCPIGCVKEVKNILKRLVEANKSVYTPEINLEDYRESKEIQDLVDFVLIESNLMNNQYKDISINVIRYSNTLRFIGVKEACY